MYADPGSVNGGASHHVHAMSNPPKVNGHVASASASGVGRYDPYATARKVSAGGPSGSAAKPSEDHSPIRRALSFNHTQPLRSSHLLSCALKALCQPSLSVRVCNFLNPVCTKALAVMFHVRIDKPHGSATVDCLIYPDRRSTSQTEFAEVSPQSPTATHTLTPIRSV